MQFILKNTYEKDSFLDRYIKQDPNIETFFDYSLSNRDSSLRYDELMKKSFSREKVANALNVFNNKYHPSPHAMIQINRLRRNDSVVVIGGQQSGLLTGPIYTINKIISILLEAKKQEEKLEASVIPIFWIAGEDHDIDEINQTYFYEGDQTKKIRIPEHNHLKQSASERKINIEDALNQIKEAFQFLGETVNTKQLYEDLRRDLSEEITYTEWCAKILSRLFYHTDLVLMDAADPEIRKIEQPFFEEMVEKNSKIRFSFIEQASKFKQESFGEPISIEEANAHLFFHENGQRFLLEKTEYGYKEKQGSRKWKEAELLQEVREGRLSLSNNVVTRPLMQDFLLPVHTFIAGPGELKYWATLKEVFHCFDRCLPIVRPRFHITFVSRQTEKNILKYKLDLEEITVNGVDNKMKQMIDSGKKIDEQQVIDEAEKELNQWLEKLTRKLTPLGIGMAPINSQFRVKVTKQLKQFEQKVEQYMYIKNEIHINRLKRIEVEISPHHHWQERYLNIYPFLNKYGEDLVEKTTWALMEKKEDLHAGQHIYITL